MADGEGPAGTFAGTPVPQLSLSDGAWVVFPEMECGEAWGIVRWLVAGWCFDRNSDRWQSGGLRQRKKRHGRCCQPLLFLL